MVLKWITSGSGQNGNGDGYIYMAFGQSLVGSNNVVVLRGNLACISVLHLLRQQPSLRCRL